MKDLLSEDTWIHDASTQQNPKGPLLQPPLPMREWLGSIDNSFYTTTIALYNRFTIVNNSKREKK